MGADQKRIGDLLGLSQSTVSRALRGDPMVSEATRARVQELCEHLNYVPHFSASSLSSRRTRTIVILVNNPRPEFAISDMHSRWVAHLHAAAQARGYRLRMEYASGWGAIASERSADGFIVFGEPGRHDLPGGTAACPMPVVFTDCCGSSVPGTVAADNAGGTGTAARHLLDLGHRCIGFYGYMPVSSGSTLCDERHRGYVAGLNNAGVAAPSALTIVQAEWPAEPEHCMPYADQVLAMVRAGATGILASTDTGAIGVMKILTRYGMRVPGDVSLIGFDDSLISRASEPMLTTVRQDLVALAGAAVDMLLHAMGTGEVGPGRVVPAPLVVRGSTAPVSRGR